MIKTFFYFIQNNLMFMIKCNNTINKNSNKM